MTTQPDNSLVERAAAYINLANEQAKTANNDQVAGSMMLATARYCVHVTAGASLSALSMNLDRKTRVDFIVDNFRKLVESEYDYYTDKFDELVLGAKAAD
jgi:hypothetical protein